MNKISSRRLNLTLTRAGSCYTRVKKDLKKEITRAVRRRLNKDILNNV